MSNTLVYSGVSKKTLAIIAITVGVLFVALIGIRYAAAVAPSDYGLHEGDTVSAAGSSDPDVYIVNELGYKRLFLNPVIFGMYGHLGGFANVKSITPATRDAFPTSGLFRLDGDQKVYGVETTGEDTGVLHWVNTTGAQAVADDPNFFKKVFVINQNEFNWYAKGTNYTSVSQVPSYARVPGSVVVTGGINISLATDNPGAATVPKGATGVTVLKFLVSNGNSSAVNVTSVSVKRGGPGAVGDFSAVYLYDGATRLTSGRTINSSTNEAAFSGLNVSVPANGYKVLSVLADVTCTGSACGLSSAAAGNVHYFSVASLAASGATATGSAMGSNFAIAGAYTGDITIAKSGSNPLTAPKIGEISAEVAQFTLTAGSTENVNVTRITLNQFGNISRGNLTNFVLKDRGTGNTLATTSSLNSKDTVVFELSSPVLFEKGNAKTYSVYASIGASAKSGDTIRFYLEDAADVYAVGQTYGYGVRVTRSDYDNGSDDGTDSSRSSVEAGQLTITFNGPISKDTVRNGKDVELFNFTMAAQANLEVRQMSMVFDGGSVLGTSGGNLMADSGTVVLYTDVKIWDVAANTVVWGPQDFAGTASGTYSAIGTCSTSGDKCQDLLFTEDVTLNAGTSRTYKVTADVANSAKIVDGDIIRAILDVSDLASNVKNLDNNTFVTAAQIVPGADLVGNNVTVKAPSLTISLATSPTSQTFIKGTTDVPFVGFNLAAASGAEMRVNSITLQCYIDENATGGGDEGQDNNVTCQQIVPSVRLKIDGSQIGDTKSPAASSGQGTGGTLTFGNLNLTIPAGTSKVVKVYGDISNSAYLNSTSEMISFDIVAAATDVTVADPSGNSITATGDAVNAGTTQTRAVTIGNAGTLTVALAPSEQDVTDPRIVVAGKSGVTLSKFKFTAQNEALTINKLRLRVTSAHANANVDDDIAALYLYDGTTNLLVAGPLAPQSGTPASAALDAFADFNNISNFVVPKDGDKVLVVKADLNTISAGADSGDEFSVDLAYAGNFQAQGSTTITSVGTANLSASAVVIRKSQPKIELVEMTSSEKILGNGTKTLLKFKITAMDGDVAIKHIRFNPAAAGLTDLQDHAVQVEGSGVNISAAAAETASASIDITFTSAEQIYAGNSKTYIYQATVSGGTDTGDAVATKIAVDSAVVTGDLDVPAAALLMLEDRDGTNLVGNATSAASATFNFIWSDMATIPHNETAGTLLVGSDDWTNGRYVRVLGTSTQTLTAPY